MSEDSDEDDMYTGAVQKHLKFLDNFDKICPQGTGKTYREKNSSDEAELEDFNDTISSPDPPSVPPKVARSPESRNDTDATPASRTRSRRNRNSLPVSCTVDLTDTPEPVVQARARRGTRRVARNVGPVTCTVDLTDTPPLPSRGGGGGVGRRGRGRGRGRRGRRSRGGLQQHQSVPSIDLSVEVNTSNLNNDSSFSDQANVNDEDVNYEMVIRVWWKMKDSDRFVIRKYQKFTSIFDHYSQQENVPHDEIYLALKDSRVIRPSDTPDSLGLLMTTFVDGGIMKNKVNLPSAQTETKADANTIELKVQHKGAKAPMRFHIRNTDNMVVLMIKCAESLEVPIEKLKFYFDGQLLKKDDTPEDLELEGGECIDLHIS